MASLTQTAKLNGHDPYACVTVLSRLPTQLGRDLADLLPHRWGAVRLTMTKYLSLSGQR